MVQKYLRNIFCNRSMCRSKLKYIVPEMSENYSNESTSMTGGAYSFIPTITDGQIRNRSGTEESIHHYVPYPIYPLVTPWNYYFRYPYVNHYPFHPTSYPLPFFNTAVQASSNGRYFHRSLVDIEGRNIIQGKRNGKGIMSLRSWEKISKKPSAKPGFIFTLMSYNVLAQDLLDQHPHLYQDNRKQSLEWKTRWNNVFKEISSFSPDILCLQEVQESHIAEYFSLLETLGYKGIFKKRTGNQSDGCAIYYKTDNVTLVESVFVEYFRPFSTVLNRDNVGILAKFVPKLHPTREFVVATTHLLYNPRRNDVRMAQMQLLLTEIEKISAGKENSFYAPVLLTGDLNTSPESDLYEFITNLSKYQNLLSRLFGGSDGSIGTLVATSPLGVTDNCQHVELLEKTQKDESTLIEEKNSDTLGNSEMIEDKKVKLAKKCYSDSRGVLPHNFYFKSVYSHGEIDKREGTTYQDEWLTVDYIFYSMKNEKNEDKLQLLSRYRLPTKDELGNRRIPNKQLGSDHLSLLAKFKLEY